MIEAWAQVLTILMGMLTVFLGNFAIIWWFRKESREDWARCQNTIDAIRDEMKNFHARMYALEEKYLKERR